jgi:hypothetical protein
MFQNWLNFSQIIARLVFHSTELNLIHTLKVFKGRSTTFVDVFSLVVGNYLKDPRDLVLVDSVTCTYTCSR